MIRWEIGAGELLDRLGILELKLSRCVRDEQRATLAAAVARAQAARRAARLDAAPGLRALEQELTVINHALWQAEDEIRKHERTQDWGARFIAVARSICRLNDRRAALKSAIDRVCGFAATEEKTYSRGAI
jgi:orotidine-5'-phosphate decarboxylase